ncbi:MAG: hypothetical protein H0W89_04890 [Candidatus Levybacteria bacterium]|nr:hypothetical protein [Candidatus Levybacteria bacterium]
MSKRKKYIGVALILFMYVIIAVAGFFVIYVLRDTLGLKKSTISQTPKVSLIPAPSGFQTYQNSEQKYSLQYPKSLHLQEKPYGFGVNTIELRSEENADPAYAPEIQVLTVPKALAATIGQDFESYYKMNENETKTIKSPLNEEESAENFTKVRNREINGLRGLDYTSTPSPNPDNQVPEIGTFVEAGDNLLIFATHEESRMQLEEVLKSFNYQK